MKLNGSGKVEGPFKNRRPNLSLSGQKFRNQSSIDVSGQFEQLAHHLYYIGYIGSIILHMVHCESIDIPYI